MVLKNAAVSGTPLFLTCLTVGQGNHFLLWQTADMAKLESDSPPSVAYKPDSTPPP